MTTPSPWYTLGLWYGALRWGTRNNIDPLRIIQLALVVEIAHEVTRNIEDATEHVAKRIRRTHAGPPPLTPVKVAELAMPTDYPERRKVRPTPWPPFTGLRVELGGDSA